MIPSSFQQFWSINPFIRFRVVDKSFIRMVIIGPYVNLRYKDVKLYKAMDISLIIQTLIILLSTFIFHQLLPDLFHQLPCIGFDRVLLQNDSEASLAAFFFLLRFYLLIEIPRGSHQV